MASSTELRFRLKISFKILLILPLGLAAQILLPRQELSPFPDFGVSISPTAYLTLTRPYGYPGIPLNNWSDLLHLNPVNGQPDRLSRAWWVERPDTVTALLRSPALTAPADTSAPQIMIDYKQGDAYFNDFSFWYHKSFSRNTFMGFSSENRSHVRFSDVITYDQQDHRFEYFSRGAKSSVRVTAGFNRLRTPFYQLTTDPLTGDQTLSTQSNLHRDRFNGSLDARYSDSKYNGRLILWQGAGAWRWADSTRNEWTRLFAATLSRPLTTHVSAHLEAGYWSQALGEWQLKAPLAVGNLHWNSNRFQMDLGVKIFGKTKFPTGKIRFQSRHFFVETALRSVLQYDLLSGTAHGVSVVLGESGYADTTFSVKLSTWQGLGGLPLPWDSTQTVPGTIRGIAFKSKLELPWLMSLRIGAAKILKGESTYDVYTTQVLNWGLDQHVYLFKRALLATLRLWGVHDFDSRSGIFNLQTQQLEPPFVIHSKTINRLNYSIEAHISDVIIAFTDVNLLQDEVWKPYFGNSWPVSYPVGRNLPPENRFRYLTVVWYFTN